MNTQQVATQSRHGKLFLINARPDPPSTDTSVRQKREWWRKGGEKEGEGVQGKEIGKDT